MPDPRSSCPIFSFALPRGRESAILAAANLLSKARNASGRSQREWTLPEPTLSAKPSETAGSCEGRRHVRRRTRGPNHQYSFSTRQDTVRRALIFFVTSFVRANVDVTWIHRKGYRGVHDHLSSLGLLFRIPRLSDPLMSRSITRRIAWEPSACLKPRPASDLPPCSRSTSSATPVLCMPTSLGPTPGSWRCAANCSILRSEFTVGGSSNRPETVSLPSFRSFSMRSRAQSKSSA